MKAERKCESGSTNLLQSRQKGIAETELPIFGNEGRVLVEKPIFSSLAEQVRKRNLRSFEVLAERSAESITSDLASQGRAEVRKQNFRSLSVNAIRKCRMELYIFGSQGRAELHIFGSHCRTKVRMQNFRSLVVKTERKRNFRSLTVKAEQKCGSGTSGLWQSRQSRSVEAEFQIFSHHNRAEVQKQNCRYLIVQSSWTCGSRT